MCFGASILLVVGFMWLEHRIYIHREAARRAEVLRDLQEIQNARQS